MAHRLGLAARDEPAPQRFIAEVTHRAAAVGITRVVDVGCATAEWDATIARLDDEENPGVYGAIAVHPTEVSGLSEADYRRLEELLAHPRVVAVGETGLDYYWDKTTPAEQEHHFRRHIALTKSVGKPLMIHDRDAHADVLRIVADEGAPEAGVIFHSFSGDARMAAECVERGYLLSFSGVLTFRNAPALHEAARVTPLDQILVETDAPFLTPHPYRGRPNAPCLVAHVIRRVAELKSCDERVVCAALSGTGARIFKF
jgi:TatD DNase family protein